MAEIILVDPKLATIQIAVDLDRVASKEQIIRIIEKALLKKSIICDKIRVVK